MPWMLVTDSLLTRYTMLRFILRWFHPCETLAFVFVLYKITLNVEFVFSSLEWILVGVVVP